MRYEDVERVVSYLFMAAGGLPVKVDEVEYTSTVYGHQNYF